MSETVKKFKTNKLLLLAIELSYQLVDEKEIESIDRTDVFYDEIIKIVDNKELLNVNINGPVASGKSTVGFAIGNEVAKACYNRKLDVRDIARDQEEYVEMIKDPSKNDTVIVIDEWNDMEDTGENVTVEQALLKYLSDVQAQRNIQKISCSPSEAPDANSSIYLEVIQPDKMSKLTHCRLIYKFRRAGVPIAQILGFVNIDVSEVLAYDWYKEYRRRKFEKMDLILKEGIFRPREMKYAGVILEVIEKMRQMAKLGLTNHDMVRSYVEHTFRMKKLPYSIPGIELSTKRAYGVLTAWKAYFKLLSQINTLQNKLESCEKPSEREELELKRGALDTNMKVVLEQVNALESGYKKMLEVKAKYDTIETDDINVNEI